MRETLTINKKKYEKCTPIESEILDIQFDRDEYGWSSKDKFISPEDASMNRIEELLNQVLAPLLPDNIEITMTRSQLFIADHENGVERVFTLQRCEPTYATQSMTTAKNKFEFLVAEAERKRISEKTIVSRGEWFQMPDAKYNRYSMVFRNGGTVPCGLQDGTDNVPSHNRGLDCLIGLGEYVWSRPAIAALDKDFDLEKGTEILDLIHERLRLKAGRSEAYRRTYGG
jgi:hypothetical protein